MAAGAFAPACLHIWEEISMAYVKISTCGHDERGKYRGGKAGDQTGTEYRIGTWYQHNPMWDTVIRFENPAIAEKIAQNAEAAARNNAIGYDQDQRTTMYKAARDMHWNIAAIGSMCEADCSSSTACVVICAGHQLGIKALQNISPDCYTGNIAQAMKNAGAVLLKDTKYLNGEDYLRRGDMVLSTGHHIFVVLSNGSKEGDQPVEAGWRRAADGKRWWYEFSDRTYATGWHKISCSTGTYWFHFDDQGYMQTGWQQIEGKWYYLDTDQGPTEGALWHEAEDRSGAMEVWKLS